MINPAAVTLLVGIFTFFCCGLGPGTDCLVLPEVACKGIGKKQLQRSNLYNLPFVIISLWG